eukprot:c17598_g1_i4 orf=67-396(-)
MVMRRRSPSYSPPPRRGRRRSPSRSPSPRGRYPPRREPPTSLLVRNLPKSCRAEDLRAPFKRFGQLRDVYLPRDYYTGYCFSLCIQRFKYCIIFSFKSSCLPDIAVNLH